MRKIHYTYESLDQLVSNKYIDNKYIKKSDLNLAEDEEEDETIEDEKPKQNEVVLKIDDKIREIKGKKKIITNRIEIIKQFQNVKVSVKKISDKDEHLFPLEENNTFEGTFAGDIEKGEAISVVKDDRKAYMLFEDIKDIKLKNKESYTLVLHTNDSVFEIKRITEKGASILFESD